MKFPSIFLITYESFLIDFPSIKDVNSESSFSFFKIDYGIFYVLVLRWQRVLELSLHLVKEAVQAGSHSILFNKLELYWL